ncbi:MAG: nucleoside diphosphate kinase regulator [Pseudomonadales bacterium]
MDEVMPRSNPPPITITEPDFKTLESLLSSEAFRNLPGSEMLQAELDRAAVVSSEEIDTDVVTMNSVVRFVEEGAYKAYQLRLVYPEQAGEPGTVSILAPVGSALLGLTVGQFIRWPASGGRQLRLRVVSVVHQPESDGTLTS